MVACRQNPPSETSSSTDIWTEPSHLPTEIADVFRHHAKQIPAGKAIAYDLMLMFGGSERFRGTIVQTPSMDRIRQHRADDVELRYDGQKVALLHADSLGVWPGARFAAFTWPYFFAAPMKLADPGTQWGTVQTLPWVAGARSPGAKLTFSAGTGDAPDDYYIIFPDAQNRVDGMAYTVTFAKTAADTTAPEPHAIRYHDYTEIDGVPIATRWTFHNWSPESGLDTALRGSATLSNIHWLALDSTAFSTAGGMMVGK